MITYRTPSGDQRIDASRHEKTGKLRVKISQMGRPGSWLLFGRHGEALDWLEDVLDMMEGAEEALEKIDRGGRGGA